MKEREARAAWRLYLHNWIPLGLLALALALGLALTDFSLVLESTLLRVICTAGLLAVIAHFIVLRGWGWRLPFVLCAIAQLEILVLLVTPLTYIAAAADLPMQDANLAHLDRMLGLDWESYFQFVCERPWLIPYVYIGYAMIVWPMFGVPIILGLAGQYRRLQQFILACLLTLVVTAAISSLLPANGTYFEYGITPDPAQFNPSGYLVQLERLPLVRAGSLRMLDSSSLAGIITFPSFHAAAAILSLWVLWSTWWMRPPALLANGAMLLATPLVGGHYFVDVFAGMLLAIVAIAAARRIGEWSLRPAAQRITRAAPAAAG